MNYGLRSKKKMKKRRKRKNPNNEWLHCTLSFFDFDMSERFRNDTERTTVNKHLYQTEHCWHFIITHIHTTKIGLFKMRENISKIPRKNNNKLSQTRQFKILHQIESNILWWRTQKFLEENIHTSQNFIYKMKRFKSDLFLKTARVFSMYASSTTTFCPRYWPQLKLNSSVTFSMTVYNRRAPTNQNQNQNQKWIFVSFLILLHDSFLSVQMIKEGKKGSVEVLPIFSTDSLISWAILAIVLMAASVNCKSIFSVLSSSICCLIKLCCGSVKIR